MGASDDAVGHHHRFDLMLPDELKDFFASVEGDIYP
jgi:hypothetical protein